MSWVWFFQDSGLLPTRCTSQLMHRQFLHCGEINILILILNLTHHPTGSLLPNCPITFKVMPPKFFKPHTSKFFKPHTSNFFKPHTSTYMLIIKQDTARSLVLPWSMSLTESTALFRMSFTRFWITPPSWFPMSETEKQTRKVRHG